MMKKCIKLFMALVMLFFTVQPANAQLRKLLKKVGNTVETVAVRKVMLRVELNTIIRHCRLSLLSVPPLQNQALSS